MQFSDIVADVLDQVDDDSDSMETRVKRYINWAQQDVSSRIEGDFNREESSFQCSAPYTTGTVSVTNGSTAITGTGTTWASSHEGMKIRIGDDEEYYTISSVGSTTSITLDQSYMGTTDSDATYIIYEDVYSLASDVLQVIDVTNPSNSLKLYFTSNQQLDALDPNPLSTGTPERWSNAGIDSNGYKQIRLYQPPDDDYVIYYVYRKKLSDLSADTDVSDIPGNFHELLYLGACARAFEYNNNPVAATYWTQYENMMETMKEESQSGSEDSVSVLRSYDEQGSSLSNFRLPPDHFSN